MNRKQRRNAKKRGVSDAAILAQDRKDTKERVGKEATAYAVRGLSAAFIIVLHDKFGFGKQRMTRVTHEVNSMFDSIIAGNISLEDVEQAVLDELGIDLTH